MNQRDAVKFVHDWLWESDTRQTDGQTWLHNYIADVSSMIMAATTNAKDRIMDLEESLKKEVDGSYAAQSRIIDLEGLVLEMSRLKCSCPTTPIICTRTGGRDSREAKILGYNIHHEGSCVLNRPEVKAIMALNLGRSP